MNKGCSLHTPGWELSGGWHGLHQAVPPHSPVDATLALQVLHAGCCVSYHLQQSLHPQAGSLGPKEGQEVTSWGQVGKALLSLLQGCRPSWTGVPTPGDQPSQLTLHELHDNVDGLLLGADANETHDVGVAVLLQDPGECCCLGSRLVGLQIPSPGVPREPEGGQEKAAEKMSLASEASRPRAGH